MRTEIALIVALLSITAGLQVGCGGECGCADIIGIDINTPDEGVDTIPTDDGADTGRDSVEPLDQGLDNGFCDILHDHIPTDQVPVDSVNEVTSDIGPAHECDTEYDCDGCDICIELQGVRKCLATPEAGMKECYDLVPCEEGNSCHYDNVFRPECGGYCAANAEYRLAEWGVNVVTPEGGATMSAAPKQYYGAVAAKPVIYIYSEQQFTLDVGVRYDEGIAYETWPEIPLSANVVWENVQVGTTECTPTATPVPDPFGMIEPPSLEIYELPEWVIPEANCLTHGETISKLLFYTGPFVGYQPPVAASLSIDQGAGMATLSITNGLDAAIPKVMVIYRDTLSNCMDPSYCPVHTARIAWGITGQVNAGETMNQDFTYAEYTVEATEQEPYPTVEGLLPEGWLEMPANLKAELQTAGLTEDEAGVFMNAWTQSMFGLLGQDADWYFPSYENGAFVIYIWPESRVEQKLPMAAIPAPTTKNRVIVEYQRIAHEFAQ